jgi:hypothetical protein
LRHAITPASIHIEFSWQGTELTQRKIELNRS